MARTEDFVFLPLGGSGEIGMNLNAYGFGPPGDRKWIVVDYGVTFGDEAAPGVELQMADPEFLRDEGENVLALLLTHAHEDHVGAVAYARDLLPLPIYATPFTAALARRKFEEAGVQDASITTIPMGATLEFGPFEVEYVTLTHSIPEPNGLIIKTPLGTVLHTGDWKIDPSPTLGPRTNDNAITKAGDNGLLAMICDSTNVLSEGESGSESGVRDRLVSLIAEQTGRVAVTTFASNVGRLFSICEAAKAADRSVCLLGRSMLRMAEVAEEVGIMPEGLTFVNPNEAGYLPKEKILYLCTGSQGEPRAALARIARDDHPDIALGEGDTVIFSSKIIPGNERGILRLMNDLVDLGVRIITEKDEHIHVSGHPCRDELRQMYAWARPEIAIPVHGEARHLEEHAILAKELGCRHAIAPRNGTLIRLAPGDPEIIDEAPAGRLYLDGRILYAEGSGAVRTRRWLADAGCVSVAIALDDRNDVVAPAEVRISGAPPRDGNGDSLLEQVEDEVEDVLDAMPRKRRGDDDLVEKAVRRAVKSTLAQLWGKKPDTQVLILRV